MTREEFQTERTRIISEMLDNPDEYGIYPTTKCFEQLDTLYDKLSLPPAEGAVPDNAAEQNKRMREWFKERTGLDDTLLSIHMEQIDVMLKGVQQQPTAEGAEAILHRHIDKQSMDELSVNVWPDMLEAMHEFAAQPLPPAKGAEEILEKYGFKIICHKEDADAINDIFVQPIVAAMQEFATLHAQRIADKMVSERLREELGLYNDWLNGAAGKYLTSPYIDEYLTSEYYLKTRDSHER